MKREAIVTWVEDHYVVTLSDGGITYGEQEFASIATAAGDYAMAWVRDGRVIY